MATYRSFTSAAALLLCASSAMAQAPANDDCSGAIVAALGNTPWDGTNATDGAGQALDPLVCNMGPFGDDQIYADVWYTFTASNSAVHSINSVSGGTPFDSRVAVYDSAVCPDDPALVLYCNDDINAFFEAGTSGWLNAGTTYTIRLGSFNAGVVAQPAILEITDLGPVPVNDTCATQIPVGMGLTPFDSTTASDAGLALDPMVCDLGPNGDEQIYADLWYTFTPATTDFYDIAAVNNNNFGGPADYDSALALYSSTACPDDPAMVIACDDDSGILNHAAMTSLSLVGGTGYLIRVGSFDLNTAENPAWLSISIGAAPALPPANDDCGTAIAAVAGPTNYDTRGATDGAGLALDPMVCDMGIFGDEQIYADAWFTFTATQTGLWQFGITANGSPPFDSRAAVYSSTVCPDDPALVIGCDDDAGGALQAQVTAPLVSGQNYMVRVGSYDSVTLAELATLNISFLAPSIANDNCASATVITAFGDYIYDSSIATTDGAAMGGFCTMGIYGDDQIHRDVWYEYTPDIGGCTYISNFNFAGFDTRIAVYDTATCPADAATVLVCNDDEEIPYTSAVFEAGLDVDLVAGQTYLIRVGTYDNATLGGPAALHIAAGPQAEFNNTTGTPQPGAPGCAVVTAYNEFCFGDGGNQMGCTNCPCGNNAPIGSGGGCLNSGGAGTRLIPSGDPSVSLPSGDTTDLRFGVDGAPPTGFCILNSGDGLAPGNPANPCFGMNSGAQAAAFDGLRCAIQNTRRHGGRSADGNGEVGVTNNPWGGEGGPPVGIAVAGGGFAVGQTRFFQIINRDDPLAICMRALNTSQAVEVTFTP